MNKRKGLCIWAGVFSALMCLLMVYTVLSILNNVNGMVDYLKDFIKEMYVGLNDAEVTEVLNMTVSVSIYIAIFAGVTTIVNFVFAFIKIEVFAKYKLVLIILAILNVFFCFNFISAILMILATRGVVNKVETRINTFTPHYGMTSDEIRESLKMRNMAEKIEILKNIKAQGGITDEEYAKVLDEIITNGVKEQ